MKRILMLAVLITAIVSTSTQAQKKSKNAEGKIVYEITLDGEVEGMMAAMLPSDIVMKFKGSKCRTEMATAMAENITLSDQKDPSSGLILLDVMGSKYAMKVDPAKVEEQKKSLPEFEVIASTETKEIAGYKCKKAIMKNKSNNEETYIYYSEELPYLENSLTSQYKNISGMPLEFNTKLNGITMTIRAKSIEKIKIADAEFVASSEYKLVTEEQLMKELSGGAE
jgi:hypothetical protein